MTKQFPGKAPIDPLKLEQHSRGEGISSKKVGHALHAAKLKKKEKKIQYAQKQAARAEILLTEDQGLVLFSSTILIIPLLVGPYWHQPTHLM